MAGGSGKTLRAASPYSVGNRKTERHVRTNVFLDFAVGLPPAVELPKRTRAAVEEKGGHGRMEK